MRSHNKTFFSKVSKILTEFNKLFNFERFLIYVFSKVQLNPYMCCLLFIFLNRKSDPNVYVGKFSDVNNKFLVKNVRN